MTMLLAFVALACSAPPAPAFFESKPPNPIVKPAAKLCYADVYARVEAGDALTVAAGVTEPADVSIDSIPGNPPGLYRCYRDQGTPVMVMITTPAMPAPIAAAGPAIISSSSPTCTGPNCTTRATCTGPNCPQPPRERFLYRVFSFPQK